MHFELSHEQEEIVRTTRAFVERVLYPHEDAVERLGHVPRELIEEIRTEATRAGLYAVNMPEEHGGGGLDPFTCNLVDRELGRASYGLQNLVARPSNILRACEGWQVEAYLRPTVRGERLECLALTEPEAGSDLRAMRTEARRDGDDYVINGLKHFISRADIADYIILWAASGAEDGPRGRRRLITTFLVDKATPGLTVRKGYDSICHSGYNNMILEFQDCRVPARAILGAEHKGLKVANTWLAATRLQVAAMCLGRARRAYEIASVHAANRRQFGRPIADNQGVSFMVADMALDLRMAELLTLEAAWKASVGRFTLEDAAAAKIAATEALGRIADRAVQILGGMGVMANFPVGRIWRDARVERIWDGTSEIQRMILAKALLRDLGR
ncbi:MAG: acyl-CoA dehydrogenase [Rhizobiales bacterium]|nr:acyl-CoA dehydrogenase [Hyphomicrobiales bacterium]